MIFAGLRRRSKRSEAARDLYRAVVEQARDPAFYRDFGVPDTLDGRFEMILLHMVLVLGRLRREGEAGAALGQALFDTMVADMDQSLREMGVGDLSVSRRIKAMGQAFYGRAKAYDTAIAADDSALADALRRNLFGTVEPDDDEIAAIAGYVRGAIAGLGGQSGAVLLAGVARFGTPPEGIGEGV